MSSLGVVGLGYVGLPLAVQAAEKGYKVVGVDLNTQLVELVNARTSPYVNDRRFATALSKIDQDQLHATTDFTALSEVDVIAICVPTPTENNIPDISFVTGASRQIGTILRKGQLIALESTVNPGVTREEVLPILEASSGLKVGQGFYLAHCPERIDPGNKRFFVGNLNRVVGGITADCTVRAIDFYSRVIDANIIPLGSTEEAEFVKSWENSHRNIMIAMANSAAIICDALDMDIDNILKGLQSKIDQFGLGLATPGIGPGGHCIPEDIHYVIRKAREQGIDTRFLDDAAELNDKMPRYAVHKLSDMVREQGQRLADMEVALLGLAYKPNIDDMRRSPSVEVGYQLVRQAKSVAVHDPYTRPIEVIKGARIAHSIDDALHGTTAIFIGTAHDVYTKSLTATKLKQAGVRYVLDGRNCLDKDALLAAGIIYKGIGK